LKRLAEIETIVGVKEASGNISQMAAIAHLLPKDFALLCGDDSITIPLISLGGVGVISVVSNEIPAEMTQLVDLARRGDLAGARAIQRKFFDLMTVNFIEPNPAPCKAAMAMMGLLEEAFRLPMVPVSDATRARIESVLKGCELIGADTQRKTKGSHAD
jgi:4-hydroxy-tetrahydrodipicolinate synthase